MAEFIRAQVSIPSDTTVPADIAVNTFHFGVGVGSLQEGIDEAQARLTTFYGAVDGLLHALCSSPATVKYYDLKDPEPRVPVDTETIALIPSTDNTMPTEVAICLSYSADPVSGVSAARRRGRLYFGPVATAVATVSSSRTVVTAAARTTLAGACDSLATPGGIAGLLWCVFSPTTAGPAPWSEPALDSAFFPITQGYVDDAFDTQRRRGTAALSRTTWSV